MKHRKLAWIVMILAGLALRLLLALQPVSTLLQRIVPDDAFYYFVIDRNASQGLGVTFDGLQATNGFHPLWAAFIFPIFAILSGRVLPITITLILGAILDTIAGTLYARLAGKMLPGAGIFTLGLYLFNPRLIAGAVNGLESALALLVMAAVLWQTSYLIKKPNLRNAGFLGLLLGMAILARSDLALLFLPVLTGAAFVIWSRREPQQKFRSLVTSASTVGLAALVTVLPWLVWSQLKTGHLIQSSAIAVPGLITEIISQGGATASLQLPVINFSLRNLIIAPGVVWLALAVSLIILQIGKIRQKGIPTDPGLSLNAKVLMWAPAVGGILIVLVHTFLRWYPREWYFLPLAAALTIPGGIMIERSKRVLSRGKRAAFIVVLCLVAIAQGVKTAQAEVYPGQIDIYHAALWVDQNLPDNTILGAFNSGILGWFSGHKVINLDGVVDWQAIQARQDSRLLDYLQSERGGEYLVDARAYVEQTYSPYFGIPLTELNPVEAFGSVDSPYGEVEVYRLPPPG